MAWIKPIYSKDKINAAGNTLINEASSDAEKMQALIIMDNWRASHSYPLHIFKKRLKQKAMKVNPNALTAQRLKRVPAILYKLKRKYPGREESITLFEMQDIAGCRAIFATMKEVNELYNEYYLKSDLKHKRIKVNNYISTPKKDGYRSFHAIYAYQSDKGKKEYNGLLVEIQLRTKLQHAWATAVEIVGFFTKQAIKSNEGDKNWRDFFRLLSSAFAMMEDCPLVPNTPIDKTELYSKIKEIEKELSVIKKIKNWTQGFKVFKEEIKNKPNLRYFLLELDIIGEKLTITGYSINQEQKAIQEYDRAEKKYHGLPQYDVVLVGVDTVNDLEKAYPNYFGDAKEFINLVKQITSSN